MPIPDCGGIDHADFTADGRTAVFTCEFAGRVAVVDVASRTLLRIIDMPVRHTHMGPQDIKLAPGRRSGSTSPTPTRAASGCSTARPRR